MPEKGWRSFGRREGRALPSARRGLPPPRGDRRQALGSDPAHVSAVAGEAKRQPVRKIRRCIARRWHTDRMTRRAAKEEGGAEPAARLRAEHAEATRRAVLAAARSLFGRNGYAQTSV